MSKVDKDRELECTKCFKFPCGCPGGGGGADDEKSKDEEVHAKKTDAINDGYVQGIKGAPANDKTAEVDTPLMLSTAPMPRPVSKQDDEIGEQNNRPAWCTLFAIATNQLKPMNARADEQLDDTANSGPNMSMGMSGTDE